MKVIRKVFGSGINVLSNDHFVAVPYYVDFSKVMVDQEGLKVIKGGTPMTKGGVKATVSNGKSNAIGILMHDVYDDNPNTSLIVHGFIDKEKAEKNTGESYDETTMEALPMIQLI